MIVMTTGLSGLMALMRQDEKPKDKADLQPFLDAMGLGGGSLFFSSYKHVVTPDCIYVSTSAKPNGVMTEILGSEFEAAEAANN